MVMSTSFQDNRKNFSLDNPGVLEI